MPEAKVSNKVAETNDYSSVSKASMLSAGYMRQEDSTVGILTDRFSRRSALINRGYFIRVWIIQRVVNDFLDFCKLIGQKAQIVSLGAGFDNLYFRLKSQRHDLDMNSLLFTELDQVSVVEKKAARILKLRDQGILTERFYEVNIPNWACRLNSDCYQLFACDLRDLEKVKEVLLKQCFLKPDRPTLFLAECVLNYFVPEESNRILDWIASTFSNVLFVAYEQILPSTGFGRFMKQHFETSGSPLLSIDAYPTAEAQNGRFLQLGWHSVLSPTMDWFYYHVLSESERERIAKLELFDEFEVWHTKCQHYVLTLATRCTAEYNVLQAEVVDRACLVGSDKWRRRANASDGVAKECAQAVNAELHIANIIPSDQEKEFALRRFGHQATFVAVMSNSRDWKQLLLVTGGFGAQSNGHGRCSTPLLLDLDTHHECFGFEPHMNAEIEVSDPYYRGNLGRLYHSATLLVTQQPGKEHSWVLVFGGRTSPDNVLGPLLLNLHKTAGAQIPLEFESQNGDGRPPERRRHAAVALKGDVVVICGGLSGNGDVLADCWALRFGEEPESCEKLSPLPVPLHSHSASVWKNSHIVVSGGLMDLEARISSTVFLFDIANNTWSQLFASVPRLTRYSHTTHILKDRFLVAIGGSSFGSDSCATKTGCDLVALDLSDNNHLAVPRCLEFRISSERTGHLYRDVAEEPILLFNHASAVCPDETDTIVISGGGGNCFSFGTLFNPALLILKVQDVC